MRLLHRNAPLLAAALLFAACNGDDDRIEVRVMTQNLAIGIRLEPVLLAPSLGALPPLVQTAWDEKTETDFALRAGRIAAAIEASGADLVGLQEVIQFYDQTPANGTPGLVPGATQATHLVADFLALLLQALADRGLDFALVSAGGTEGVVSNADIELTGNLTPVPSDYRVVDREAVIARSTVQVTAVRRGNFASALQLEIGGAVPFSYERGWVAVDATKDGRPFTFVSTHLDPFDPRVQSAQATELLSIAPSSAPTIVVGDINSDPTDVQWPAYGLLVSPTTGFADAAVDVSAAATTCCREALMSDPADPLERRVDVVLHSPHFQTTAVTVHGTDAASFTSGHWPSDHAGVSAVLELE